MVIGANTSPLAGKDGEAASGRVKDRLLWETDNNVTIQVVPKGEQCEVFARGELQLGILIEQMRREGLEMAVSPPKVVVQDGMEPWEEVIVDVADEFGGAVINGLTGARKGEILEQQPMAGDRVRIVCHVPARGLLGFSSAIAMATRGSAVVNHVFLEMRPHAGPLGNDLARGKLVATEGGKATAHALGLLAPRAKGDAFFLRPNTEVYAGMVVGEHARGGDLDVNVCRAKEMTNVRTVFKDEKNALAPPVERSVEELIAYMGDDEMLEVTPKSVRLRKAELDPKARARMAREKKKAANNAAQQKK